MVDAPYTEERRPGSLPKCPTGIKGLDDITLGGLPRGRPTLVCGSAGCGKTLFGIEFLVHGARDFGEPGVCLSFEERAEDIVANVASLGFDLPALMAANQLHLEYVHVDRGQIEETGDYDLEALFVRLGYAIDRLGAKRVLLDTIESLFAGLSDAFILRAELRRLFAWLKDKGVTAVITGEQGDGTLTRHGLEEYVSDCVILLDHRVNAAVFTRRLRIVKYRGSLHGTNDYPFLIDTDGISVLPITTLGLSHTVPTARISSGVPRLDGMLGGEGYYRGSSILISGTAGTGKSTLAAQFVHTACGRGERCLVFGFEESLHQVSRNMRSVGIDLAPWVPAGLLHFDATRPTMYGLEMHLVRLHRLVEAFRPSVVVLDPITSLLDTAPPVEVKGMLMRLVDMLKGRHITALMTNLTGGGEHLEQTTVHISSLIDTWLLLRDVESNGERNRSLMILKSRGMAHSNQVREFVLTDRGIELRDVYLGPAGMLTGSARLAQEAREAAEEEQQRQALARQRLQSERKRLALAAQMAALQAELEAEDLLLQQLAGQETRRQAQHDQGRLAMARSRRADAEAPVAAAGRVTGTEDGHA